MSAEWLWTWPGVRANEPLGRHSQFGVGGPADFFLRLRDPATLPELVARCTATATPLTVVGAGSNALILDSGIRGLVIKLSGRNLLVEADAVRLGAGTMLPRAALDLAAQGWTGLEWGIGVPGSCGASVWGNAGAFGGEVSTSLIDCTVIAPDGSTTVLDARACAFAYRSSRLRTELAGHVVLSARFRVGRDAVRAVRQRTEAIQAERKRTQPYGVRSLGSTFKNPPGDHAGRLIEAAGLKGRRVGDAQISPKHANFILNMASATAADVLALVRIAGEEVHERFGIHLEPEIVVLGEPALAAAP